jgi:spore coat protein H
MRNVQFWILFFVSHFGLAQLPEWGVVFPQNEVTKIYLTLPQDSLDLMLSNEYLGNGIEFSASFRFVSNALTDTVDVVGIRTRGNTSLQAAKKSFKVDFSVNNGIGKWQGIRELNLNGNHNDPSLMRAKLTWDLMRRYDLPGSRVSYTELYINDEYKGLYINVEFIDDIFTDNYFNEKTGNRWKCLYPATLEYLGPNGSNYQVNTSWGTPIYELENNTQLNDYQPLADLVDVLNNEPSSTFPCEIRKIFNVDRFLQYLAIDVMTGNWDGANFNKNNFYIFQNDKTHRLEFIPYDTDNTWGIDWFNVAWPTQNIYNWDGDNNLILYNRMMNTPEFKSIFSFYVDQIANYFASPEFITNVNQIQDVITTSALNDTYRTLDYGFDDNDFLNALTTAWGNHVPYGILSYANARSVSALQQTNNSIAPSQPHSFQWSVDTDSVKIEFLSPQNITGLAYRPAGTTSWIVLQANEVHNGIWDNRYSALVPLNGYTGSWEWQMSVNGITNNPCQTYWTHFGFAELGVKINEIAPSGTNNALDESGLLEDWCELYKIPGSTFNWNNLWITDDANDPNKWKLKNVSSSVGPFFLLWADDQPEEGFRHLSFKLNNQAEFLGISYLDNGEFHWLDSLSYQGIPMLQSTGRSQDGIGPWITFSTSTPNVSNQLVSVSEQDLTRDFSIYPNPTSEYLHFPKTECVSVWEMNGKLVIQAYNVETINVASLSAGLYIVKLKESVQVFEKLN